MFRFAHRNLHRVKIVLDVFHPLKVPGRDPPTDVRGTGIKNRRFPVFREIGVVSAEIRHFTFVELLVGGKDSSIVPHDDSLSVGRVINDDSSGKNGFQSGDMKVLEANVFTFRHVKKRGFIAFHYQHGTLFAGNFQILHIAETNCRDTRFLVAFQQIASLWQKNASFAVGDRKIDGFLNRSGIIRHAVRFGAEVGDIDKSACVQIRHSAKNIQLVFHAFNQIFPFQKQRFSLRSGRIFQVIFIRLAISGMNGGLFFDPIRKIRIGYPHRFRLGFQLRDPLSQILRKRGRMNHRDAGGIKSKGV